MDEDKKKMWFPASATQFAQLWLWAIYIILSCFHFLIFEIRIIIISMKLFINKQVSSPSRSHSCFFSWGKLGESPQHEIDVRDQKTYPLLCLSFRRHCLSSSHLEGTMPSNCAWFYTPITTPQKLNLMYAATRAWKINGLWEGKS